MIVEPCCYQKQMGELIAAHPTVAHFFTNGDVRLADFMDFLIGQSPGCDVFLSLVSVTEETLAAIVRLLDRKEGDTPLVRSFTLLTQGGERAMVHRYLADYICKDGRVCVCEDRVSFRCLTVGNGTNHFVLNGSINQQSVYAVQFFTLTCQEDEYNDVMDVFLSKKRMKNINR